MNKENWPIWIWLIGSWIAILYLGWVATKAIDERREMQKQLIHISEKLNNRK